MAPANLEKVAMGSPRGARLTGVRGDWGGAFPVSLTLLFRPGGVFTLLFLSESSLPLVTPVSRPVPGGNCGTGQTIWQSQPLWFSW